MTSKALRRPPIHSHHYRDYRQYLAHPVFLAARQVAMESTGWLCQLCGEMATEVHHTTYPRWGMFDVPSNLMPICHACHCKLEGKDK